MKFEVNGIGLIKVTPEKNDPWNEAISTFPSIVANPNGDDSINFGTTKIKGKKVNLFITIKGKPELEKAIEEAIAIRENMKKLAAEKEAENAVKKQDYLATCPIDCEPCKINWKNGDLCSAEYEAADGTKVIDSDLITSDFGIAFINKSDLEAKRAGNQKSAESAMDHQKSAEAEREAKFTEARETRKEVVIRTWTETRRAQEGGQWGDYCFAITEYALPDGKTKQKAINTY